MQGSQQVSVVKTISEQVKHQHGVQESPSVFRGVSFGHLGPRKDLRAKEVNRGLCDQWIGY